MNILLLNMSTLNTVDKTTKIVEQCTYTVDEEVKEAFSHYRDTTNQYYGQMEPVPMFLMDALNARQDQLHAIVVLNTKGTLQTNDFSIDQKMRNISPHSVKS